MRLNLKCSLVTVVCAVILCCLQCQAQTASQSPLKRAVDAFKKKDYRGAVELCDRAIKANPSSIGAHYYKAVSLHYLNQMTAAKREYTWVANSGNNKLAANAKKALADLSGYKTQYQGSGASAGGYSRVSGRKPMVMDFYTTWCGPCKVLAPILEGVEKSYHGKVDFKRLDCDLPQNKALMKQYKIQAFPTLVFLDRNGQEANRMRGLPRGDVSAILKQRIDTLLK